MSPATPLFIGNEIYRRSTYGPRHPLAIPRVSTVMDLCRALGWLHAANYRESPCATPAQLARFHDPAYIAALIEAERSQRVSPEIGARYNLGRLENPVYPEMFHRPATACGASILAAELLAEGAARIVYSPAGGTHHGRPDRAAGFCYFNDPVLAILALLDRGVAPVAYVDIDVHHGDGVEAAFAGDARVLCLSVHEEGRWPRSGAAHEDAGGSARNYPVPPGMNDSELAFLVDEAILPEIAALRPAAIVMQCGADALADDPLGRQDLSNNAHWRTVAALMALAPRLLVLGGGGYNPWSVARCWSGVWAMLNGLAVPERLPPEAEGVLRALSWNRAAGRNPPERWFATLRDRPNEGPVREAVRRLVSSPGGSRYRPAAAGP